MVSPVYTTGIFRTIFRGLILQLGSPCGRSLRHAIQLCILVTICTFAAVTGRLVAG
jgi:hypothetical protein